MCPTKKNLNLLGSVITWEQKAYNKHVEADLSV